MQTLEQLEHTQPFVKRPAIRVATPINMSIMERRLSVIGAAALAVIAAKRRDLLSVPLTAAGVALLVQGMTGHSPINEALGRSSSVIDQHHAVSVPHQQGIHVVETITILAPRADLYRFWHNLGNLPAIFSNIASVQLLSNGHSHWIAKAPAGMTLEWEAAIITEVENEVIGWRSLDGASVPNAGSVRFTDAPGNRGTEIKVTLEYAPPGGQLGRAVAAMFGKNPSAQIAADLRRFKAMMEAGEIPDNTSPHGRRLPFGG